MSSSPPVTSAASHHLDTLPGLSAEQREILKEIEEVSRWLDKAIHLPVVGGVGLDGLIGLVPVGGDVVSAMITGYLVIRAKNLGIPNDKVVRMIGNAAADGVLGTVPLAGDIFDFAWKANVKNVNIIREHFGLSEWKRNIPPAEVTAMKAQSQENAARAAEVFGALREKWGGQKSPLTPRGSGHTPAQGGGELVIPEETRVPLLGGEALLLLTHGVVADSQKQHTTSSVTTGTVTGTAYTGVHGSVNTRVDHHVHDDFWILTPDGREVSVWFRNRDINVRDGQRVTLIQSSAPAGKGRFTILGLFNHTTNDLKMFSGKRTLAGGVAPFGRLGFLSAVGAGAGLVVGAAMGAAEGNAGAGVVGGLVLGGFATFVVAVAYYGARNDGRVRKKLNELTKKLQALV